ncbi:hypothetical protein ACFL20_08775 [Spirochaetota bacterium]
MKKNIIQDRVYYKIAWSDFYKYDKYNILGIPELSGIISVQKKVKTRLRDLIFISCYRDGLRIGLRKFLDPQFTVLPNNLDALKEMDLYFKYTVIDNPLADVQDILYWLIKTYDPPYNTTDFKDSKRYGDIFVKEVQLNKNDIIERI